MMIKEDNISIHQKKTSNPQDIPGLRSQIESQAKEIQSQENTLTKLTASVAKYKSELEQNADLPPGQQEEDDERMRRYIQLDQRLYMLKAENEVLRECMTPVQQQLRGMTTDPAVNLVFQRLYKEIRENQEKVRQTYDDLQAWKFAPDSEDGKRLIFRMRQLLQRNTDLGKINQAGRTTRLETEAAMLRALVEELRTNNQEMDGVVEEMDTDTDCLQSTLLILQQQVTTADTVVHALSSELDRHRRGRAAELIERIAKEAATAAVAAAAAAAAAETGTGAGPGAVADEEEEEEVEQNSPRQEAAGPSDSGAVAMDTSVGRADASVLSPSSAAPVESRTE